MQEEIEGHHETIDFKQFTKPVDPLQTLRDDIAAADSGEPIAWQTVIKSTKDLAERFWNCFSNDDKRKFLNIYDSAWVTYRHSIPVQNARKILALLEKGQLRVVQGSKVVYEDEKFVVRTGEGEVSEFKSDILIEALGQEYVVSRVESPLLQRKLAWFVLRLREV